MSNVSRSIYQKVCEDNKKLKQDIKTLVLREDERLYVNTKEKWRVEFGKQRQFTNLIKIAAGLYQIKKTEQQLLIQNNVQLERLESERPMLVHNIISSMYQFSAQENKLSRELLEDCGEFINLMLSKIGCGTEDASPKSDHEDYGGLDLLRRIRKEI